MAHTPLVESYGLDEAWMEITGPGITLQDGYDLSALLRRRAREELGITLSAGVSFCKVFAKLGSDYRKPDATTVISKANYKQIRRNEYIIYNLFKCTTRSNSSFSKRRSPSDGKF